MLAPQISFESATAPEISADVQEIRSGVFPFPIHVIKGASVSSLTLSKGVRVGDQEFYRWIQQAVYGRGVYRRTLALMAIHSLMPGTDGSFIRYASVFGQATAALAQKAGESLGGPLGGAIAGGLADVATLLGNVGNENYVIATRLWLLHSCVPIRYKSQSDFDANSGEIAKTELEIDYEYFEEYSLGLPPTLNALAGVVTG